MEIKFEKVTYKKNITNLDMVFNENEITSIIGKNGSGKTDILDLIACSIFPSEGQISIGRRKINKDLRKKEIFDIKKQISYLVEDYQNQLFNINILEDIKYNVNNIDQKKLDDLLKLFNLNADILKKNYLEVSNSEKKKICLIKTFLKNSKILILDNPNSDLDNKCVQNLIKILKKMRHEGKIIVLTSHNSEFILQVSDRVIVFNERKVILDGSKYEVMTNKSILNSINMETPDVIRFEDKVLKLKKIRLGYRDNINDLIKDIYRNAK